MGDEHHAEAEPLAQRVEQRQHLGLDETSSADTGSSAISSSGSSASARAIAMRWRWPPENSCGKRSVTTGSSPTSASNSRVRADA